MRPPLTPTTRLLPRRRVRRAESGQVLVLAVIALVMILVAILILFDVHAIIRGKVKEQNGVDAAALAGANWQKHTLNIIGELNLIKATTVLISDPFFGIGQKPEDFLLAKPIETFIDPNTGAVDQDAILQEVDRIENDKEKLRKAVSLITQMQTRMSFVGPLIGFGAAQQAAKNNGLPVSEDAGEMMLKMLEVIQDDNVYGNPALAPQVINDYNWRVPYTGMFEALTDLQYDGKEKKYVAKGVAAGTKAQWLGMPYLTSEPPSPLLPYLQSRAFYDAIHANYWCALRHVLEMDFSGNWWGSFQVAYHQSFIEESEILPVRINFFAGVAPYRTADDMGVIDRLLGPAGSTDSFVQKISSVYDNADPYPYRVDAETGVITINPKRDASGNIVVNPADTDMRYQVLPEITWAVFDSHWETYGSEQKNYWNQYLRSDFKPGTDYFSGALAYFEATQSNKPSSGRLMPAPDFGGKNAKYSNRVRSVKNQLANQTARIHADATAKPFGSIEDEQGTVLPPFAAGGLVLPVFTRTSLIPIAMEPVHGFSSLDINWFYFLTEYIPILGESNSLEEAWQKVVAAHPGHAPGFLYYHNALVKLNDLKWRQMGIEWLNTPATWKRVEKPDGTYTSVPTSYNKDHCNDWSSGGGGGGGRQGPTSLH